MHKQLLGSLLLVLGLAGGTGCTADEADDLDGGAGTDADTDGDTDADTDGDTDGDTDADTDGDTDGDADSETESGTNTDVDTGTSTTCDSGSFNFFVMSLEAIQTLSGSDEGFGGNLGGLAGADTKCQAAANAVGACDKTWVAFLSVTDDGTGNPVNAIDRIGEGPWYDVSGYLLAETKADLLFPRPQGDTTIVWNDGWQDWPFNKCLTTELGNCNHSYGDTHDTLTGSNRQGLLYSSDPKFTCNDWTSTDVNVQLPIGHSWPRRLNSTDPNETHWLYAHTNCGEGGGPGGGGTTNCNGCGVNINITDSFEDGVGGDGGYGAWYCFGL